MMFATQRKLEGDEVREMPRGTSIRRSCGALLLLLAWGAACGDGSRSATNDDLIADAFLIQTAEEMHLEPAAGRNPRLVLEGVSRTMGSDELARHMDVAEWLQVFPFVGPEPATGVLVIDKAATQIALFNPTYDEAAGKLSYEIQTLRGADLPSDATMVQLRLQSCPAEDFYCAPNCFKSCGSINHVGTCWQWFPPGCFPCHCNDLIAECNSGPREQCCNQEGGCLPANRVEVDCPYDRTC